MKRARFHDVFILLKISSELFFEIIFLESFVSIIPNYILGFSSIPVNEKWLHNGVDTRERAEMIIGIDAARRSHSVKRVDYIMIFDYLLEKE